MLKSVSVFDGMFFNVEAYEVSIREKTAGSMVIVTSHGAMVTVITLHAGDPGSIHGRAKIFHMRNVQTCVCVFSGPT